MKKILIITLLLIIFTFIWATEQDYALSFNGDDKVTLPNLFTSSNFTSELTIEYWFKGTNLASPVRFQDAYYYIVPGYTLGGNICAIMSTNGGTSNAPIICTPAEVNDNEWHHIAVTWKQNTTNGFVTYFDGILRNSINAVNTALPAISDAWLGALNNDEFITGQLDKVRIWNTARTTDQIQNNMNSELTGDEAGLVTYYKMSNGTGTTLNDNKTNGTVYNGTISGATWALVNSEELTLPVELSAFTAVFTASNTVNILWTTQSESNMIGYHILRAEEDNLTSANRVSNYLVEAVNLSIEHTYSYIDQAIQYNTKYYYWLQSFENDGTIQYFGPIQIETGDIPDTPPAIPLITQLKRAYPNPFNPNTTIHFEIAEEDRVVIEIFNVKGQKIKTLYNQIVNPGHHHILWDGTDSNSRKTSSGIYFYRMISGKYTETHKMLMVK
ncbi:MAG: T9SS type A sorting domain-containing protein [Candidatus Cloacimonetes bacterium]|nr:T9SS type A sorting domain-containing protein [Candidatus Cloacimonadota bacterium]